MTPSRKKEIIWQLKRLANFSAEFNRFYKKAVPGFSRQYEARAHRYVLMEIEWEAIELAIELNDQRDIIKKFALYGGYLQYTDGNGTVHEFNTAKRAVDYVIATSF